jgi:pyruvate dehydrogenase E2 component (dihydrolipoamide acetyltransferase)
MLIKVGDVVKAGSVIAEVETDKATMDLEIFQEGTVLYVAAKSGDSIPVNGLLAILGKPGESFEELLSGGAPAPAVEEKPKAKEETKVEVAVSAPKNFSFSKKNGRR